MQRMRLSSWTSQSSQAVEYADEQHFSQANVQWRFHRTSTSHVDNRLWPSVCEHRTPDTRRDRTMVTLL